MGQGSSKHFITHSAITCSVQAEDIVACVLLLYNPTTKCPLHVHAYRCDSETTAQALHQFLQVLINRPENQKRFSELEAKLGLQSQVTSNRSSPPKIAPKRTETSPRRFESSLGSDTGTSRESECSEELSPTSPTVPKANLYDSLAAELRAKLNGNGPPLLLPPRDYDTVHRSKGNLAATELRRCRNSLIVGATGPKVITPSRSRGSSGIGSDLAPSPERQEGHSSSDDEWVQRENHTILPPPVNRSNRTYIPDRSPANHFNDNNQPPSYLYPREQQTSSRSTNTQYKSSDRFSRSTNQEEPIRPRSQSREEEKIKPIITRPPNFESKFKNILDEKRFGEDEDYHNDGRNVPLKFAQDKKRLDRTFRQAEGQEKRIFEKERSHDRYYRDDEQMCDVPRYNEKKMEKENLAYRENLTDKQKFRESLIEKQKSNRYSSRYMDQEPDFFHQQKTPVSRQNHQELTEGNKFVSKNKSKFENADRNSSNSYTGEATIERLNYRNKSTDKKPTRVYNEKSASGYDSHNAYKEADSLPYRDNIDRVVKSPVIRYNSFDESTFGDIMVSDQHRSRERDAIFLQQEKVRQASRYHNGEPPSRYADHEDFNISRRRIVESQRDRSPETVLRISPKDRFHNAREKFQAIERERSYHDLGSHIRRQEPRRNSLERNGNVIVQHRYDNRKIDWSSDEEQQVPRRSSGYHDVDTFGGHDQLPSSRGLGGAKSLSNLVKGYRHSYAEPLARPLPRNSGRVGLAAVNPF
ncbi:hypothetical protein Bhyg_13441 [Pseudolycoriella hygida]|uniref:PID domain-containing protein n=1 Tax=Pseudolycoriella hygida TaxID=35572 RepID=A0A9Q0MPK7_9DIPT|nr:hypothetical protein Bhyg_13441 [Pseudolycoriella hygida]